MPNIEKIKYNGVVMLKYRISVGSRCRFCTFSSHSNTRFSGSCVVMSPRIPIPKCADGGGLYIFLDKKQFKVLKNDGRFNLLNT
jgi:hypothetical protein